MAGSEEVINVVTWAGRRRARKFATVTVLGVYLAGVPLLLPRMRDDLAHAGRLRASTAAWMWSTYGAHGVLFVAALVQPPTRARLPSIVPAVGVGLAVVGGALDAAGAHRFAGPAQLTGTRAGNLITGGIYRYSRHPQYVGLVTALAGLAIARRSLPALALTAGLGAAYRAWAPIEEEHLARCFGAPYRRYRAATHRWFGLPRTAAPT